MESNNKLEYNKIDGILARIIGGFLCFGSLVIKCNLKTIDEIMEIKPEDFENYEIFR